MKAVVRVLGLTLALVVAAALPYAHGASSGGCYVSCPNSELYFIYTTYGCCGPISSLDFTCPGGGQAYGYAYDDGWGPQFCV